MGYKLVQERGSRWVQVRGYRWEQVRGCKQELVKEYRESDYNWLLEMGCREMQALAGRPKAGCWQWLQPEAWVQGQLDLHCSWYGQQVLEKWLLQGCKQKPVASDSPRGLRQGLQRRQQQHGRQQLWPGLARPQWERQQQATGQKQAAAGKWPGLCTLEHAQ